MTQETIEAAIKTKSIVEFQYSGHTRLVEPHVLGVKGHVVQLLGYQIGGSSSSGGIPEWRRFNLAGITALRKTSESFPGRRPFPSGRHSSWDQELAIVDE